MGTPAWKWIAALAALALAVAAFAFLPVADWIASLDTWRGWCAGSSAFAAERR